MFMFVLQFSSMEGQTGLDQATATEGFSGLNARSSSKTGLP
jgi:hypothetical protein